MNFRVAKEKPVLLLTMGDPGGVGPEIILKSLRNSFPKNSIPIVIGSESVFRYASERLAIPFRPNVIRSLDDPMLQPNQINLLDITDEAEVTYEKRIGKKLPPAGKRFAIAKVSKWNACLAHAALEKAAFGAARYQIHAVVTAPVHKGAMRLVDPHFLGHTEYLARAARVKDFAMMFVSERFCVTLATTHLPLKRVARVLSPQGIVTKIRLTNEFLKERLKIKFPRIGVASLNPHGREFGTEEDEIVLPAVQAARRKGIRVEGPLPGDQVFHDAYEGRFDAVVAMYHDQGLAPFKMIAFRDGVNVTLGLPYLRTSPDHGTAFDIAYRNRAFPSAMINSIRLADRGVLRSTSSR
ncbi:MAG: 4-hydroxythreonine-4-phosphate dehydrogenase PdxA [Omnitrophica bacterium RIFCSPLOWO2_12_FULL_50_11]|nr:MAG: 4-hydroxythreonine-4-phosphate dehydrogenase PdxA [Omnitrophica bacterium RIFCSPLOWO2_12_FULL_50_11]